LPPGFTVEAVPQSVKTLWTGKALYSRKVQSSSGQVDVTRSLARAFMLVKPEEYQDLRSFYQKVAAADQGQIVLDTAPAPQGN